MLLAQTLSGPKMATGVDGGASSVTGRVCADELPQVPFAVTDIVPPPVPCIAETELVVELPLHPLGNVHV